MSDPNKEPADWMECLSSWGEEARSVQDFTADPENLGNRYPMARSHGRTWGPGIVPAVLVLVGCIVAAVAFAWWVL